MSVSPANLTQNGRDPYSFGCAATRQDGALSLAEKRRFGRLMGARGRNAGRRGIWVPRATGSESQLAWADLRTESRAPICAHLRRLRVPLHVCNEAAAYHARLMDLARDKAHGKRSVRINTAEQNLCISTRPLNTWRSLPRRRARGVSVARDKHRERINALLLKIGMLSAGWGWVTPAHCSEAEATNFAPLARQKVSRVIPFENCGQNASAGESVHNSAPQKSHFPYEFFTGRKSPKPPRGTQRQAATSRHRDRRGRFVPRPQPAPFRPKAGSAGRPASQPPVPKKIDPLPCNTLPPQPAQAAEAPPAPAPCVARVVQPVSCAVQPDTEAVSAEKTQRVERETSARHALPRREDGRQLGVRVTPGAEVVHARLARRVGEAVGLSDGVRDPDPVAVAQTPSTRAQLLAAVPGLACDRGLQNKLLGQRVSVLAAWHAWAAAFGGQAPPGENYGGRVVHCARQYQAHFDGAGGWCPYRPWLRRRVSRGGRRK